VLGNNKKLGGYHIMAQNKDTEKNKLSKEKLVSLIKSDIDEARGYFEEYVYPKVKERYDIYNASDEYYSNKMPRLHKKSKIVSTDVADVIEWIMPKLMQIFFGSDDVISVTGREPEDAQKAEVMQKLVNYQLNVLNNGFMTFYKWFKDALITGLGVVKCYWDRKYEYSDTYTEYVNEERVGEFDANPDIEIISKTEWYEEPAVDNGFLEQSGSKVYEIKYKFKSLVKDQPVIETIPITEFLYDPTARTLDEAKYVIHKKEVTADYLRRKAEAGVYKEEAVERAIENAMSSEEVSTYDTYYLISEEEKRAINLNDDDGTPRKKITIYECYEKLDINKDGRLEDVIITVAEDEVLRIEENTYGRHPFFGLTAYIEPYKVFGKGYSDIIGQLQDLKTAIMKELVINLALSNESKLLVREDAFYVEDFVNNRPFVRIRQNVPNIHNVAVPLEPKPIHQLTMPMLEYIDYIRENRSGITRYSQGLDAKSLNKTATGVSMIMEASNQRLDLIVRIFAETGIRSLFRFLVELNQKFISKEFVIRLTNGYFEVSPDDIQGNFDLVVNSGISRGTPDQQLQAIQLMVQHTMQVLMPLGLADAEKIYNLTKTMYEKMGYKNVNDFIKSPEQMQQEQMMGQQQGMGMMPQGQGMGMPPQPQVGQPMPQQQQEMPQDIPPEMMQQLMAQMGGM